MVFGGTGTVGSADVTSVVVNCSTTGPFAVGGMISGLNGGKVGLKNNSNGDLLTVSSDGSYSFPADTPSGGPYDIVVQTQPTYPPAEENCVVANGSGTAGGNVVNVNITCTKKSYLLTGTVNGQTGNVVVQDNGANDQTTTVSSPNFSFGMIPSGTGYLVTVLSKPITQSCVVVNASGTITNANVSNVMVNCTYTDPGIACGSGTYCTAGTQECCDPEGAPNCMTSGNSCGNYTTDLKCDSAADCGGTKVCCMSAATHGNTIYYSATCANSPCPGGNDTLCDPMASSPCKTGTCKPDSNLAGYYSCQ